MYTDRAFRLRPVRVGPALHFLILGRECFPLWRLVRPNQDGERAERAVISTLFGANDGGLHRPTHIGLTSLRRMIRRCALATLRATTIWYLNQKFGTWIWTRYHIVVQLWVYTTNVSCNVIIRRKLVDAARRLLMMASSMFCAKHMRLVSRSANVWMLYAVWLGSYSNKTPCDPK